MSPKPEITKMRDLPVIPVTIGDMSFNRTGLWRYLMPVIKDRPAPCQQACPLGMPSPDFINDLIRHDAAGALARIMDFNPMPGITGRLCYHPCQSKCLRRGLDQAVQIQKLERHLADAAPDPEPHPAQGGKGRAAVLGAGPLGLSAAYFLGRAGVEVTLLDPLDQAGGFLNDTAKDKLPGRILAREVERLGNAAGVKFVLGAEYAAGDAGKIGQGVDLVIHDQTAHGGDSAPAASLALLAKKLKTAKTLLDAAGLCPSGAYKASQVAVAAAAGRELALKAMHAMGLERETEHLQEVISTGEPDKAVKAEDIRYGLFEAKQSDLAVIKAEAISHSQALAEAERCLSCGHCNRCGRCLVFCPDVSLSLGQGDAKPQVDEMHCKGCGICAHECPRRAIVMER